MISLVAFFCGQPIYGSENSVQQAKQNLLSVFPDSVRLKRDGSLFLFSFCPDNTCTELRQMVESNLEENALIYLYYFGDYYELARWRQIDGVNVQITALVEKLNVAQCKKNKKALKNCLAKELRKSGVRVYFIRYDESENTVNRIW